jgi:ADP-heptose:LPS heptosyltransferase
MSAPHVLVVRPDRLGDVLICGPAVRAVAANAARVTMLVSPAGAEAAALLPGVDDVLVWECPWIGLPARAVETPEMLRVIAKLTDHGIDEALILTSFHQSALPTALLLRMAGVSTIAAVSADYPGSLLDVRIHDPSDAPEPMRMATIAHHAGYPLPAADDGLLALRVPTSSIDVPDEPYVVVHPGTDAPARAYPVASWCAVVAALTAVGRTVVVTGSAAERGACATVAAAGQAPGRVVDLCGRTDVAALAAVAQRAVVVVVANTGTAHVAAAVGTPVVSLFAPVVSALRWAPFGVPTLVLGDQDAACRGSRARECPVVGHPCLGGVTAAEVSAAVDELAPRAVIGAVR